MLINSYSTNIKSLYNELDKQGISFNPLFNFVMENIKQEESKIREENLRNIERAKILESIRTNPNCDTINEESIKQLMRDAEQKRKERAVKIPVFYRGVLENRGWIKFITPSQFTRGKFYYQYIKLLDMKDIEYVKEFSKKDIVRLMLSGNVAVFCSCPDFLYKGYKYLGYNTGYGIFREMRFPKIKNPNLEGTICKHLISVAEVFMLNYMRIYKDLINSNYWQSQYEEDNITVKKKK